MNRLLLSIVVLLVGCGRPTSQPVPSIPAAPQYGNGPFEYKIIERDETPNLRESQVQLSLETTNDVAKKATKDDLQQLWKILGPTMGMGRVFIDIRTPVSGVGPWGQITRLRDLKTGLWEVSINKYEYGVDAEPYNFMDKIDRSKKNQQSMILTLPVVNQIIERLKRNGWEIKTRKEAYVSAQQPRRGGLSSDVVLTPEGINLVVYKMDDTELFDVVQLLTAEFGIGDEVKRKLQSVIGSPEYFRGTANGVASWDWTIRDYEVSFLHMNSGADTIYIEYASNK